ncbi:MAG: hypothetical protein K6F15_09695 [Treponema sp.]|nr:hypothetical protein [Treponema sp.]
MVQFYFLSVLSSLLLGFILFFQKVDDGQENQKKEDDLSFLDEKSSSFSSLFTTDSFFTSSLFHLILGALSVISALLTLLSPYSGVFFFGDLLISLACFFGGASILVNYYIESSSSEVKLPDLLSLLLVDGKKYLGIFCIVVSIIHFVIPGVVFF